MSYKRFCDYCEKELTEEERSKNTYPAITYGSGPYGMGKHSYDQCTECAKLVAEFVASRKVKV